MFLIIVYHFLITKSNTEDIIYVIQLCHITLSYKLCNSLSFDMSYHTCGCFVQKSLPEKSLKFSQLAMAEFSTCK